MKSKNIIMLLIFILGGIVIGGMIASAVKTVPAVSWLSYSKTFGLDLNEPVLINLSVLKIAFGFELTINVAQIICIAGALILYKKIR